MENGSDIADTFASIPMDEITHVIYSFMIPLEDGSISYDRHRLSAFVEYMRSAHPHVKVMAAVGGWCDYDQVELAGRFSRVAMGQWRAERFANTISYAVYKHNLDGIDLDWEYPDENDSINHAWVMAQLRRAMPGKYISMAVSHYSGHYLPESLDVCDFINVMAYDMPGHSTAELGYECLSHWASRIPTGKICLGIPLYAWPESVSLGPDADVSSHGERARAAGFYGGYFFWAAHHDSGHVRKIIDISREEAPDE